MNNSVSVNAANQEIFRPIRVGTMALDHRLVVPPHGGGGGHLIGPVESFEQHCAHWLSKLDGGMQWLGGAATFVGSPLPPGFVAVGVGANGPGWFRHPLFVERMSDFAGRIHAGGGFVSCQMVLQGGMPLGPSPVVTGFADHRIPHVMALDEVEWMVREYGASAALAAEAGVDAIEIHANHDDLVQWFLSPISNHRTDRYGGSPEARRRFLREIVAAIRAAVHRPITLGLRLNLDEMIEGGYGIDDCCEMVAGFTADGGVDYFSFDIGGNWGAPSYIPSAWHRGDRHGDDWADLCGLAKQATDLPVVYAGRVATAERAAEILAAGQADLIAMARATMADPEHVTKVRLGLATEVRPCIGLNECIHAHMVDGLPYGCGSNPRWARESEPGQPPAVGVADRKEILVIGGGPGGSEFAGLAAERGHHVHLWERNGHLGGAIAIAAMARANAQYRDWITWQVGRLGRAGVHVTLGRSATVADILAARADVVVVATGATPRKPTIDGADAAHVVQAAEALAGAPLGRRVLVISEDDGPAPLSVADHLAGLGHQVTLAFQTPGPSPLVGKYSIGGMLRRLDEEGVELVANARVVAIGAAGDNVTLAHSFSNRRWIAGPFDSVVLACGSIANDGLYQELRAHHPAVHLLGDAYAPRRMIFATRQAWDLAKLL